MSKFSRSGKFFLIRGQFRVICPLGKISALNILMAGSLSRSGKRPLRTAAEVGFAVRESRQKHGLTQTDLAGLAGTGLRFISELERGKPNMSLDKVLAVLAALGLRLSLDDMP